MNNMLEQSEQNNGELNESVKGISKWIQNMREQRKKDDEIFALLFEQCGTEYVHNAEQIAWGKLYMMRRMDDINESAILFYDDVLSLADAIKRIKAEMLLAAKVREAYFTAKERAEENGIIINE